MRQDKIKGFSLRKRGFSYNDISKKLKISKSTLSKWFSNLSWSKEIKQKLIQKSFVKISRKFEQMNKKRSLFWKNRRRESRQEAFKDFNQLLKYPLFICGVVIYWGEGDRNPKNPVRISNTDPRMLRIFMKFLIEICKVEKTKIHAHMVLYPDLREKECKKYWSSRIGVSSSFFYKTQRIEGGHKRKKLEFGICAISVSNVCLKEKILVWIENFASKI